MIYRFGMFDFDAESGHLRKQARAVPLERQPARVLAVLLARAGELVSREEVRQSVWGDDTHVDFDRGLAYCLSQIRGALGDRGDNPRFVQTVPRRGYRFIAPVIVESATSAEERVSEVPTPSPADVPSVEWPARSRVRPVRVAAFASLLALLLAAWFLASRRAEAVQRPGAPTRQNLYHLGNLVFYPTGVPSARIAFAKVGAKVTQLTVADPDVMVTARRE